MSAHLGQLRAVAQACAVLSDNCFSWFGAPTHPLSQRLTADLGREEARRLGVPFLGEVPLDASLRERSDSGKPVVATEPDSALSAVYVDIARKVWTAVERGRQIKTPPRIVVES